MGTPSSQPSFSSGEIGDALAARMDVAKYGSALRRARNVLLATAGGAYSRPGLRHVGEVYFSAYRHRPIPFQFSSDQSYVLELGPGSMRVVYDGGYVLRPELIVYNALQTNPLVVAINDSGYQPGWEVVFKGITGMTEINGRILRVLSATDTLVFFDVNATGWGAFTGSTGGVDGAAEGGEGGQPPPPEPPAPGDLPEPTPPYVDDEEPPPVVRCVSVDAYLGGHRAGDAVGGDPLRMMQADGKAAFDGFVQSNSIGTARRFRMVTISGIALTVSDTAPVAVQVEDGPVVFVKAMLLRGDEMVAVEDADGFRWETLVSCKSVGRGPVAKISAWDGVYGAGDEPGRLIFTHNRKNFDEEQVP